MQTSSLFSCLHQCTHSLSPSAIYPISQKCLFSSSSILLAGRRVRFPQESRLSDQSRRATVKSSKSQQKLVVVGSFPGSSEKPDPRDYIKAADLGGVKVQTSSRARVNNHKSSASAAASSSSGSSAASSVSGGLPPPSSISSKIKKGGLLSKLQSLGVRGATASSTEWLRRQMTDPYVRKAHTERYRSRAAFKLQQIDDRYRVLFPGANVVDLGSCPGGWTQIATQRHASNVISVDLEPMEPVEGAHFIRGDFTTEEVQQDIIRRLNGRKVDVVLSDMAPSTSGNSSTDHIRIMVLCEEALAFAKRVLAPNGSFLCKIFAGGSEVTFRQLLRADFAGGVKMVKPDASRSDSHEIFILATGFKSQSLAELQKKSASANLGNDKEESEGGDVSQPQVDSSAKMSLDYRL